MMKAEVGVMCPEAKGSQRVSAASRHLERRILSPEKEPPGVPTPPPPVCGKGSPGVPTNPDSLEMRLLFISELRVDFFLSGSGTLDGETGLLPWPPWPWIWTSHLLLRLPGLLNEKLGERSGPHGAGPVVASL